MNCESQIFEMEKVAHNSYTYDEYNELSHEAQVWEEEVYGKMRASVIASGGSRFAWCDELLEAQYEADILMEHMRSVDPLQDKSAWIKARGHLEAMQHAMFTLREMQRKHRRRGCRGHRHHGRRLRRRYDD